MSFGGGGGGQLTAHTHDPAIPLDGGSLASNATSFSLANQSLLVSDGVNIQEVAVGANETVLKVSGGAVGWGADTGASFIQVTKSFTDISGGEIDIYTLPAANSISNIFTDIQTAFTASNAVEVGDAADPNGYLQSADWTVGPGLTGATRGTYVTNFKGMRSVSGTTDIKAVGFSAGGVSTAVYVDLFNDSARDNEIYGICFNDTGSKFYICGSQHDKIYEYDLAPSYDISTAVFNQDFGVGAQAANPYDVIFNDTGSKMYVSDQVTAAVYEYDLGTNYDLSTAVYNASSLSVVGQDANPTGITWNDTGSKFYMVGNVNDKVSEYDAGTNYDITTCVYLQNYDIAAVAPKATGLRFNNDGTAMYLCGEQNDKAYQWTLGTGFNVTTATFSQDFSVAGQDTIPTGITFNSTFTKMYICGVQNVSTYEYDLDAPDTAGSVDFYLQVVS